MKTGPKGIALIKKFEGWRSKAYKDSVGVWTIGYGHTSMAGSPKVVPGMVITKEEGERILKKDLRKYEKAVQDSVRVPLSQEQFDALVSFCYNVGPGNLRKSSVLKCVNLRKFSEVPSRLMLWNKAGGRVLRGLTRRRAAEGELWSSGSREDKFASASFPDAPRGKAPLESTTNIAAGMSAVAGGSAAVNEIVQNTNNIMQAAPWVLLVLVIIGATLWIWHERNKKSREDGI